MKFTECYYTYQDSLSLNWAYWNNSNLFLVEGRTLFFSSRALWASLKTFAVVDSLPDIWRSSLAPNNIKSLSISPRCRKICRPPRAEEKHSLRQTVKTISSRPNLGISQTNHGVTQAREGMTVLTGLFFFFPFSQMPIGALTIGFCVEAFPGNDTFGRGEEVAIIAACH